METECEAPSFSGSVTLRNVCMEVSSASGLIDALNLSTAMMILSAVTLPACVCRVILKSSHPALEDLHSVLDQQILNPLQARQRVDSVCPTYCIQGEPLRPRIRVSSFVPWFADRKRHSRGTRLGGNRLPAACKPKQNPAAAIRTGYCAC